MYTLNGRRLCGISKGLLCDSFLIPAMYRNIEKGGSVSKVSEMIERQLGGLPTSTSAIFVLLAYYRLP